jgi:hypothetical protein
MRLLWVFEGFFVRNQRLLSGIEVWLCWKLRFLGEMEFFRGRTSGPFVWDRLLSEAGILALDLRIWLIFINLSLRIWIQMGRQGGIARFTGSVGNINCYFDAGIEVVRRKPAISKKRWKTSPRYLKSRESAKVFGASSLIASCLWRGLPAPMKRLADGSAYGRLVGAVRELTGRDGQLWDAGMLQGMDLATDSVGPHFVSVRDQGPGARDQQGLCAEGPYQLVGIDQLMADLDAALGGAAGQKASTYVIAHPFWGDGYVHEEAMSEWRGGDTTNSEKANREPRPIGWKRGKHDKVELPRVPGVWGAKHDGSGRLCGPLPIPEGFKTPQRRVRVWVHATEVVETYWLPFQKRFTLADGERRFSNGFVTDWETGSGDWASEYKIPDRDWRAEWMGDGTYVVFTAIEVQEKRGRHWVRLPWCCKFGIQEVVVVAGGIELSGQASELEFERLEAAISGSLRQDRRNRPSFGKVGYLDAEGKIVIVEGWPKVGKEIKVWSLRDLLPPGRLVPLCDRSVQASGLEGGFTQAGLFSAVFVMCSAVETAGHSGEVTAAPEVDGGYNGMVIMEFKGHHVPWLDIIGRGLSELSKTAFRNSGVRYEGLVARTSVGASEGSAIRAGP